MIDSQHDSWGLLCQSMFSCMLVHSRAIFLIGSIVDEALCPNCALLRGQTQPPAPEDWHYNTWLYIINQDRSNLYKIGISRDLRGRLSTLQGANPHPLRVLWKAGRYMYGDARGLELELHRRYAQFRTQTNGQREWFCLTWEQIKEIQKFVDNCSE